MRSSKAKRVVDWLRSHPEASFAECARAQMLRVGATMVKKAAREEGVAPSRKRQERRPQWEVRRTSSGGTGALPGGGACGAVAEKRFRL
jgi:hypothetical protein